MDAGIQQRSASTANRIQFPGLFISWFAAMPNLQPERDRPAKALIAPVDQQGGDARHEPVVQTDKKSAPSRARGLVIRSVSMPGCGSTGFSRRTACPGLRARSRSARSRRHADRRRSPDPEVVREKFSRIRFDGEFHAAASSGRQALYGVPCTNPICTGRPRACNFATALRRSCPMRPAPIRLTVFIESCAGKIDPDPAIACRRGRSANCHAHAHSGRSARWTRRGKIASPYTKSTGSSDETFWF